MGICRNDRKIDSSFLFPPDATDCDGEEEEEEEEVSLFAVFAEFIVSSIDSRAAIRCEINDPNRVSRIWHRSSTSMSKRHFEERRGH
jgi:hypothetical protein